MNLVPAVSGTLGSTGGGGGGTDLDRSGAFIPVARPLKYGGNDRRDHSHETYLPVARALTAPRSPRYDGDSDNFVVAPTLRSNPRNNSNGGTEASMLVAHALTAERHDASEDGTGRGTPLAFNWQSGDDPRFGVGDRPTALSANQTPAVLARGARRLTVTECERLQGLPDGWTCICGAEGEHGRCTCPDSPRYAALGDAMTSTVVQWLGERLLAAAGGAA